ncbi:MAG TPA: efflux RND transporter periplasmic adaptor subunit [Chloroflexota bacterium]|nr:efflux RND transporter periplasmic adaptor subunit [Chloroflexota bacterium]
MLKAVDLVKLGALGFLLVGCSAIGNGGNAQRTSPAQSGAVGTIVTIAKVTTGTISQSVSYAGTVQASDSVNLSPQTSGRLVKLDVDVGSQVKTGDPIAELDKTTLQAQVAASQAALDAANVKLQQIQAGARSETADAAKQAALSADAKLAAEQAQGRPEAIAQAKANLATAQAKLQAEKNGSTPEAIATAKANLDSAQAKLTALLKGPTPDQIKSAELQVEQSKDSMAGANASKDAACRGSGPQCEAAQATAFAAATAVQVANQNLKTLTDPPTAENVAQAKDAVTAAEQAYQLTLHLYSATDIAQAQAAVDAAQQAYNLAQNPYLPTDVAQAQAAATAAQDQAKLAASPYTDLDVKAAQAAVEQAKAALQVSQSNLNQATLVAPFNGIVTAKLLSPGALATASTPVVTIMSLNPQVQFAVQESQLGNLKVGQAVQLTASAYPGKTFAAKITSIFPAADPKLHTFTVVVEPTNSTSQMAPGLFVNLLLTLKSDANAILVPSNALVDSNGQTAVFTIANNTAHLVPVSTSLSDSTNTEVLTGLKPGQDVAITGQASLTEGSPIRVAGAPGSGATGAGGRPANGAAARGTPAARSGQPAAGNATGGARPTPAANPTKAGGA